MPLDFNRAMVLFLVMGSNFQATYRTLSTKIDVTKVLDHEKSNGGSILLSKGIWMQSGTPEYLFKSIRPCKQFNISQRVFS